jgi:hypothetical protein
MALQLTTVRVSDLNTFYSLFLSLSRLTDLVGTYFAVVALSHWRTCVRDGLLGKQERWINTSALLRGITQEPSNGCQLNKRTCASVCR